MKKKNFKGEFIHAYKRKIGELLSEKGYKFIGNSAKNLKLNMNIMPNMILSVC